MLSMILPMIFAPNEIPGNVTTVISGSVTPKTFFPIFDPIVVTRELLSGEKVINGERTGIVERFDNVSRYLFVSRMISRLDQLLNLCHLV